MKQRMTVAVTSLALSLTACSTVGTAGDAGSEGANSTVVLLTHDSFAVSRKVLADFERESGLSVQTRALLDTCFRQVEYAGVLAGAQNPEGAQRLIDFLLSSSFQEDLPGRMYVYPADPKAQLPPDWERFAPLSEDPHTVDPATIDAKREQWIEQWTDVVVG